MSGMTTVLVADRPSASLDPDRISVENPPLRSAEQEWRFRFCGELRHRLLSNLVELDVTPQHQTRFKACGSNAWVQYSKATDSYRVRSDACNLRWCPACRRAAGQHTQRWLSQIFELKPRHGWKLLTFTVKHGRLPLADQVKALRLAFRRLRQRSFWKAAVAGGVYILELSFNSESQTWHPHFHVLADTKYIAQALLSKQWLTATRTSPIVDIRQVTNTATAIEYLTKYLTKSPPRSVTQHNDRMREYIHALHGARMINRFGTTPPYVPPDSSDLPADDWEPIQPLHSLLSSAARGDERAKLLLHLIGGAPDATIHPDLDHGSQPPLPFLSGGT